MNSTVTDILDDIQKFYGKKLNDSQLVHYGAELDKLDEDTLCLATHAIKNKEIILPTPLTICKYYNEAVEHAHNERKNQAPIFADLERNANRSQHGKEALALMTALGEHKITRAQYIEGMHTLGDKYGSNWHWHADNLKAFWDSEPKRYAKSQFYRNRTGLD